MLGVVLAGWRRGGVPGPSAGAGSPMRGSKVAGAVGGGEPNCLRGDVFGVTPRVEVRGRVVGVRPPFARPGIEWRSCRSGHMVVVFVGPVANGPVVGTPNRLPKTRTGCGLEDFSPSKWKQEGAARRVMRLLLSLSPLIDDVPTDVPLSLPGPFFIRCPADAGGLCVNSRVRMRYRVNLSMRVGRLGCSLHLGVVGAIMCACFGEFFTLDLKRSSEISKRRGLASSLAATMATALRLSLATPRHPLHSSAGPAPPPSRLRPAASVSTARSL